jgi:tetratricopeptide (TPR) repeat protein
VGSIATAQSKELSELSSQAQVALQSQQFAKAAELYGQVVKLDPKSALAHSNLGLAFYMGGNYAEAIEQFTKALALEPRLDRTRVLLALAYFDSGQVEHAVPLLEAAYSRTKDDPIIVAHLGLAYLRENKDDQALAMLSRWADLEPNSADALYFKGKASVYVASNSFAQLSKAAPDSYRMFQLRAEMLRQQGMTPAAISEYKKAITQRPDAVGLHYALGTLYREAGRLDESLDEFQEELKTSPNDAMTNYLAGDVCLQQNKLADAERYLSRALELQPTLSEAQLDLAKIYNRQGRPKDAITLLQSVVTADSNQQDAHYLLFGIYKDLGQMDEAKKELQLFEELKKKNSDKEEKRMRLDAAD